MKSNFVKIRNNIYQGGYPDEGFPEHITAVVNLVSSFDGRTPPLEKIVNVKAYSWLPIPDGPSPGLLWLDMAVGIVENYVKAGLVVYIHCMAGVSRSAMVTAAYLMKAEGGEHHAILNDMAQKNSNVDPAPAFVLLLREYEKFV